MKTYAYQIPNAISIEPGKKNMVDVLLATNIQKMDTEETKYEFDLYRLTDISDRSNLKESIESNFELWVERAKDQEIEMLGLPIREKRDMLLNECDVKYCNAELWSGMSDSEKTLWTEYKQALRDIPTQDGYPYEVIWPELPKKAE